MVISSARIDFYFLGFWKEFLICQLTTAMLLQRLKVKDIPNPYHSRALIREKLSTDPDSEIANLQFCLMCPL